MNCNPDYRDIVTGNLRLENQKFHREVLDAIETMRQEMNERLISMDERHEKTTKQLIEKLAQITREKEDLELKLNYNSQVQKKNGALERIDEIQKVLEAMEQKKTQEPAPETTKTTTTTVNEVKIPKISETSRHISQVPMSSEMPRITVKNTIVPEKPKGILLKPTVDTSYVPPVMPEFPKDNRPVAERKEQLLREMGEYYTFGQTTKPCDWKILLPDGSCMELQLPSEATVLDIKLMVQEQQKVAVNRQKFLIRGQEHKDREYLHGILVCTGLSTARIYYR